MLCGGSEKKNNDQKNDSTARRAETGHFTGQACIIRGRPLGCLETKQVTAFGEHQEESTDKKVAEEAFK